MKINWHFQHKWSGLVCCLLLTVFCVSGILLNHRGFSDGIDVSRALLPPFYRHHNWNGGLMRGTLPVGNGKVAVYGTSGMFVTDSAATVFADFNEGLPETAAERAVRAMEADTAGNLYALTPTALYFRGARDSVWRTLARAQDDRFSDFTLCGDKLVVLGRSYLYTLNVNLDSGATLERHILRTSQPRALERTSAFRVVWMLHGGELFGLPGRLVVDFIALAMIALCITGACIWLLPRLRCRNIGLHVRLHRKVGIWGMILFVVVALTGWMLRPPVMVPLALWKVPAPQGTALHNPSNPWHDKLRMIRYDDASHLWLLSTSHGFWCAPALDEVFEPMENTPPVSVMGLNVWCPDGQGRWLCGSFSGLYRWNVLSGRSVDYFTGNEPEGTDGPPVGKNKISGFSRDFGQDRVVLYDSGVQGLCQPPEMATLPMPLWNVALEAHSGRIYFGESATWFFVFVAGAIVLWCLYSGWKSRRRSKSSDRRPAS